AGGDAPKAARLPHEGDPPARPRRLLRSAVDADPARHRPALHQGGVPRPLVPGPRPRRAPSLPRGLRAAPLRAEVDARRRGTSVRRPAAGGAMIAVGEFARGKGALTWRS